VPKAGLGIVLLGTTGEGELGRILLHPCSTLVFKPSPPICFGQIGEGGENVDGADLGGS